MQIKVINIQFSISLTILIRSVTVKTLISLVDFYIVKVDTPFLLYFVDMDRLQVYYNNIIDTLIGPITALRSCYGPYKQDSTSTKKRLVLGQDQCAGYRINKTSKIIGQGVAKSHNYIYTEYTYILIYLYTKHTDVPMY